MCRGILRLFRAFFPLPPSTTQLIFLSSFSVSLSLSAEAGERQFSTHTRAFRFRFTFISFYIFLFAFFGCLPTWEAVLSLGFLWDTTADQLFWFFRGFYQCFGVSVVNHPFILLLLLLFSIIYGCLCVRDTCLRKFGNVHISRVSLWLD